VDHETRSGAGTLEPDPESELAQLGEMITRLGRRMHRRAVAELEPLGVTHGQARLLRVLQRRGGPVKMHELAEALEVVPRVVTSMVDGLASAALVERSIDEADRRVVLVSLSTAGSDLLDALGLARANAAVSVLGSLSARDRSALSRILRSAIEGRQGSGPLCD
jgi:DNA-binding MarR family transcriptional regulator